MEQFIYSKNNVISEELCEEIIAYYENSNVDSKIHNNSLLLSFNSNKNFLHIETEIIKILKEHINNYLNNHITLIQNDKYKKNIYIQNYTIEKIPKNKINSYEEFIVSNNTTILKFIFYLNTINNENQSGIDIFLDDKHIVPFQGKLILFPCDWTFPFKHLSSHSHDKYILKGNVLSNYFIGNDNK